MSYQIYAPLGNTGLTITNNIVRDADGYYRETVSGTFIPWSVAVSGTFDEACTERTSRRIYDTPSIDPSAWNDGWYSWFMYDDSRALKANQQFYVKGGVPRLSDELVATAAEIEAEIAAEHGDGSYEGSGAPTVEQIDAQLTASHGSGSWVDTGETKEDIAAEVKTVLRASQGSGSWEGTSAPSALTIANQVAATLRASQGSGSWEGYTPAQISTQVMSDLLAAHGSGTYNLTAAEVAAAVEALLSANHGANSWEGDSYEAVVGMVFDQEYNDGAGLGLAKAFLLHNGQLALDDLTSAVFTLYEDDPLTPLWTGSVAEADEFGVFQLSTSPFDVLEVNKLYTMACAITCDGVTYTSANLQLSVR